ncbi:hypothetical protein QYF36_010881 [Acer negundo]|nr:hypothetical protein QYF36_010881 [Acer negundo]
MTTPTPQEEIRAGMSCFHETIWNGISKFLRRVDTALKNIGINECVPYNAPLIQFSSWMGGDREEQALESKLTLENSGGEREHGRGPSQRGGTSYRGRGRGHGNYSQTGYGGNYSQTGYGKATQSPTTAVIANQTSPTAIELSSTTQSSPQSVTPSHNANNNNSSSSTRSNNSSPPPNMKSLQDIYSSTEKETKLVVTVNVHGMGSEDVLVEIKDGSVIDHRPGP